MRINSVVIAVCIGFAANHASAASVTKIDLSFNGLNLTRFGGPVGTLNFQISVPDDAIDLSPESPRNGMFEATVKIGFGGVSEYASGWIQLRDQIDKDSLFLTVRFPSGASLEPASLQLCTALILAFMILRARCCRRSRRMIWHQVLPHTSPDSVITFESVDGKLAQAVGANSQAIRSILPRLNLW